MRRDTRNWLITYAILGGFAGGVGATVFAVFWAVAKLVLWALP